MLSLVAVEGHLIYFSIQILGLLLQYVMTVIPKQLLQKFC